VFLKFSKSWLGFKRVHFFGYDCTTEAYTLGAARRQAIMDLPMPRTLKELQGLLGCGNYFHNHVHMYADLAAPLYEMTKKDTVFNDYTWLEPTRAEALRAYKQALCAAQALFYPDYSLTWVLRTDASKKGMGGVLFQVKVYPDGRQEWQVIMFVSQKFSAQAANWPVIEQEMGAIVFVVTKLEFYLRGKRFILETDHANLQWLENSTVPKIIRWRSKLQSFDFELRHIPGKDNKDADYLSRCHDDTDTPAVSPDAAAVVPHTSNIAAVQQDAPLVAAKPQNLIAQVHGGRMGHHGARRTWNALNDLFPGHRIAYRLVEDFVSSCAVCQKDRLGMFDVLTPVYRTLMSPNKRRTVGVDTLTVTPTDKYGNTYINVVVVHATKLCALYPTASHTGLDMALALFKFFSTYGVYENLMSDPGSDLMSEVVEHLTKWYGIRHVFSLVDRHQSNGVEGTNKSILRHLKAFVADERIADRWSAPEVIYLIQYIINSSISEETKASPHSLHFGTEDATYLRLPQGLSDTATAHEYVRLLDDNLRTLWDIAQKHQRTLIAKRGGNEDPAKQNQYQPGDLVLFQRDPSTPLPSKLTLRFTGPFEVIAQHKNDVQCRHLCVKTVHTFHVERLKLFHGGREKGEEIARLDHDQYEVDTILYYRGNPMLRQSMEFYIRFADGDERWVTWNKDLFDSVPYETFCRAHPPLFPLIFTQKEAQRRISALNKTPITEVDEGDRVFVDLRSRGGAGWYNGLDLPRSEQLTYVLPCVYKRFVGNTKLKIMLDSPVTGEEFPVDHYFVQAYGSCRVLNKDTMVLVDAALCLKHPGIMPAR